MTRPSHAVARCRRHAGRPRRSERRRFDARRHRRRCHRRPFSSRRVDSVVGRARKQRIQPRRLRRSHRQTEVSRRPRAVGTDGRTTLTRRMPTLQSISSPSSPRSSGRRTRRCRCIECFVGRRVSVERRNARRWKINSLATRGAQRSETKQRNEKLRLRLTRTSRRECRGGLRRRKRV